MNKIAELRVMADFHLWIKFQDKSAKVIDLKPMFDNVDEDIEKSEFGHVQHDEDGLKWPGGYTLTNKQIIEMPAATIDTFI